MIDKTNPFQATLKERFLLTKSSSTKKTYHVTLDLKNSEISFNGGDSIGIFAQNDPLLVQYLLDAMKAKGDEIIQDPKSLKPLSIRDFLMFKANLSRLSSSFLKLIYEYETVHDKKNQLSHLLQSENKPILSEYLATHDPLDLLKEYSEVKAPLQELCIQFGPLLPRFYSVASSLKMSPGEVDLTVALFTFTHGGEQRFGVASHFLCHLAEPHHTPVPIYVQPAHGFTLPSDPHTPIIMIGPGTGVAPFRAFLQERICQGASGKNWLFFGERNRASDFFYEEFFLSLQAEQKLRLDLAFSRDQQEKIYVQHRLYENKADVWAWIEEGASLFVCGDAHRMAKDVEAMLRKIIQEEGNLNEEGAKAYLKNLRSQKRYLLDVY
jgi:sulfite reductase (NADPH) flavoprotein alpha-component